MNPLIILYGMSAVFLAIAIWTWRMPEKRWINWLKSDRNYFEIDFSKYNQKKIRSLTIAFFLFDAVCLSLVGLTVKEHPVLAWIFMGGVLASIIVYWFVFLVFCKKSKYKKKYKK